VQVGEVEDLPLAISLSVLFKANGLGNGHIKKHLPLIHQGPHHTVTGCSNYPPPGVYTTIETAIAILKERGITQTSEQLQEYLDRDLWRPLMVVEPERVGGEDTPTTNTAAVPPPTISAPAAATAGEVTEYDGFTSPLSIPVAQTLDNDEFFRDLADSQALF
jgi:hypothetical protein